jgi:hypothetical protein
MIVFTMQMTYCGSTEQDVLCVNERQVMVQAKCARDVPSVNSEGVTVNLLLRPATSLVP